MDRMIKTRILGRDVYLNFSMAVLFDATDKYGSVTAMLEAMQGNVTDSFKPTVWAFVRMQNDAELARRALGYDPGVMLTEKDFSDLRLINPGDYVAMRQAVSEAITAGYKRETDDDEEVDLVLEELERKKATAGD